jgi:hypothetical protein
MGPVTEDCLERAGLSCNPMTGEKHFKQVSVPEGEMEKEEIQLKLKVHE